MLRPMPAANTRTFRLTDEESAVVDRLVNCGLYATPSKVVGEGLRLLERKVDTELIEKWFVLGLTPEEAECIPFDLLTRVRQSLRAKVREVLDDAYDGESTGGDRFFARWRQRLTAAVKLPKLGVWRPTQSPFTQPDA